MQTQEEQVIRTEYSELMQKSYIDYAMSVIISRALPDVRDGLKPVQRRTLYDMYELGIRWDRPYRKCARIVGDTMGKYHPHGDSSIYESLVVMAQEFKKELPLVDGHGNFGSVEGDGAAAMRYTEARLQKVTQEAFLADLDQDVVDFQPNFDGTEREPTVLPVRLPNLLINGAEGIAVGMVTSIPPHNPGEVIDAVKATIRNSRITSEELMQYIKGPDFPTGGIVINQSELAEIYRTGTGKIRLRGRIETEKTKNGKERLVITEIPYTMMGANIGKFLNEVASLVETRQTTDIVDISNQSSKDGIRIVLELRKNADAQKLIRLLCKKTRLEDTFGVNMLAVVDGRPKTLSLKQVIEQHIDFQFEMTTRKYRTMLNRETEKKEIQEGLIKACDVIDLIIEILRGSKSREQVRRCLVEGVTDGIVFRTRTSERAAKKLLFTAKQADAILEMRLYRLIGLEIEALNAEYEQTLSHIASYRDILDHYDSMAQVIIKDLDHLKKEYAIPRKTAVEDAEETVCEEKPPEEIEMAVLLDRFGYVRAMDVSAYERSREAADAASRFVIRCKNTDRLCVFTDTGREHLLKAGEIPLGRCRDRGIPVDNLCAYSAQEEEILFVAPLTQIREETLLFVTRHGMLKQVAGSEFDVTKRTSRATKLADDDRLLAVKCKGEAEQIILQTKDGFFLRFALDEIPAQKKAAYGVRGIRLSDGDRLEQVYLPVPKEDAVTVYQEKPIHLNRLHIGRRDTRGVKARV